eukprot:3566262-Prymnesium_polylepis.1
MRRWLPWLRRARSSRRSTFGCCDKITDAPVAALAASCPQLSSLDLCECDKITDAAAAALAA